MKTPLFDLWFLVTASDAIGATLAAFYLYRLKTRFSRFLALCLIGVVVEAVIAAASLLVFWPNELTVAPAFAIARSVGRGFKAGCMWTLVLYLLNFCEGIHRKVGGSD